jgi:hypothetical protein
VKPSDLSEKQIELITYIFNNYYYDKEKIVYIPIVSFLIRKESERPEAKSLIDKVAILNGIKKTYPGEVEEIIFKA